jgi:hypothetical protein
MAAAQAMAKGSVGQGSLGRRRGAEAARVGGSWRKSAFLGGRLAVGPRRPRPVSRILVTSPAVQVIESPESSVFFCCIRFSSIQRDEIVLFRKDRDEFACR